MLSQLAHHEIIESTANSLLTVGVAFFIHGHSVGHHNSGSRAGGAVQLEAAFNERHQLSVDLLLGHHGILAGVVMIVTAAFVGQVAKEVLELYSQGILAPAQIRAVLAIGGLICADHSIGQGSSQGRILSEGVHALAAGIAFQIDLRAQGHGNAGGAIQLGNIRRQRSNLFRGEGRAQCQVGHGTSHGGGGVTVQHHGDAQFGRLGSSLQRIGAGGHSVQRSTEGNRIHDIIANTALNNLGIDGIAIHIVHGGNVGLQTTDGAIDAQAAHLLNGHLGNQIHSALLVGKTPVFVRVQLTVLVHVLKGIAITFDDGHTGFGSIAQGCTTFIDDTDPAVSGGLGGILGFSGSEGHHAQNHSQSNQQRYQLLHTCFPFQFWPYFGQCWVHCSKNNGLGKSFVVTVPFLE